MRRILRLAPAALLASTVPAHAAQLPPRDECAADRSFAAFRTRLRAIVAREDARALLALVPRDIEWSFGGDGGKASFTREWKLGAGQRSAIWAELRAVLALGCAWERGRASMPYMFTGVPADRDVFTTLIPVRTGVTLRARASIKARVVQRLRWDVLRQGEGDRGGRWVRVRTDGGVAGFVARAAVRSPISYRALFERRGGQWMMTAWIAGD